MDGVVMYKRPSDGKFETQLERERRLAHNVRMQFNRTFESSHLSAWIFSNLLLFYLFVFETGYEIAAQAMLIAYVINVSIQSGSGLSLPSGPTLQALVHRKC